MRADFLAQILILRDDVAARGGDDEFLPRGSMQAGDVADLRVLDRERRRLLHLPADELIEILLARRHLFEADERDPGDGIGHDQADASRPAADAIEHAAEGADERGPVVDVRRGQRGHQDALGQRLAACADTTAFPPRNSIAAADTRLAAISTATGGAVALRSDERMLIRRR